MTISLMERSQVNSARPGDRALEIIDEYRDRAEELFAVEPLENEFPTYANHLSYLGSSSLWLARAGDNLAGAYKWRGALNAAVELQNQGADREVVASMGNHLWGALLSASMTGMSLVGFVPGTAPDRKKQGAIDFAKSHGVDFQLNVVGETLDESLDAARQYADTNQVPFVHPFDNLDVIAGQGTLADDILRHFPDVNNVVAPIGGGGLLTGTRQRFSALGHDVTMYGAQAQGSDSLSLSLGHEAPVAASQPNPRFGGLQVRETGRLVLYASNQTLAPENIVTISNDEVDRVETSYLDDNEYRMLDPNLARPYEPSSLVAVASLMALLPRLQGNTVVIGTGHNAPLGPQTTTRTPRSRVMSGRILR